MTSRDSCSDRLARLRGTVIPADQDGRASQALLDRLANAASTQEAMSSYDALAIERQATIARMTRDGATARQIADVLGVTAGWVRTVRAKVGLKARQ